jgi:hypothetical protein
MPQVLPVLQAAEDEAPPNEKALPPETFEAKVDIFLETCVLPQSGQVTPSIEDELRTNSSKDSSHSLHSNSKMGIDISLLIFDISVPCIPFIRARLTGTRTASIHLDARMRD